MVDFVYENVQKIYYFLCKAQEKGLSTSSIGEQLYVCDNEKKVAAYKKIIHFAKKQLNEKLC